MARRGRGAAARTKAAPDGRNGAVNGSGHHPDVPGDEPGARTIGALALKRWAARGPDRGADDDGGDTPPTYGPFDEDDVAHETAPPERVDFGAVRVPVPRGGEVSVEPEDGRLQAVHVMLPAGRLSVSALAAPRTERLWPDLAAEIDESLREGGATVRSFTGEWGRELHARTGDASSLFVGVDGPRWMLYGVATGPTSAAAELDAALRTMLRETVVVRGRSPYPVRTVLPLTVPDELPHPEVAPDRVPVPRMPAERPVTPPRPVPSVDPPTTVTAVVDGGDTVPHGIPRTVAGAPAREGDRPAFDARPADLAAAAPIPADAGNGDPASTATGDAEVSRTAARGLFRRRPERPSARPTQRRVAELLAEAERDRAVTERTGGSSARPGRPAAGPDEPGQDPPDRATPTPRPARGTNGHVDGPRANGFGPRELTHDHRPTSGVDATGWGTRFGDGPAPYDRPAADEAGRGAAGAARNSAHVGEPLDEPPVTSHGVPGAVGNDLSGAAWPGPGHRSYVAGPQVDSPTVSGALPDEWSREYGPATAALGASDHARLDSRSDSPFDSGFGAGGDFDDGVEATVWASLVLGEPRPSSGIAADGSDDWTLPLPVVRPEPEPTRPPAHEEAPHGRRARRAAEERDAAGRRSAGHRAPDGSASDQWAADRWADRSTSDRYRDPVRGARAPDRPRHAGGDDEREPAAYERSTRASRRAARAQARHAEEPDAGHADRARHRRPDY